MNRTFTLFVILGMLLGVAVGWACNAYLEPAAAKLAADDFGLITYAFLRLIRMIIAPLVFSTLVAGIAKMEDAATVGRVGGRAILWFIIASLVSLTLGAVIVTWLQPGAGLHLPIPTLNAKPEGVSAADFTPKGFIDHTIPSSIVDAMARNEILQIVVFSLLVGTAAATLGKRVPVVMELIEQVVQIMLKVTNFVMMTAPLAIFAALASTVAEHGVTILFTYAQYIGGFYLALLILWIVTVLAASLFIGGRALGVVWAVREPILLGFSTRSSEAAYPKTLEELERFGVAPRIASFVLPLGYSFNLMGSMVYATFAILFICQAYGVHMTLERQITMLLLLMVTSKGLAGVPAAAIVVILATLAYFDLPMAGLALILGVDHIMDMGRTATNIMGNSVAAAVVARWEKALGNPVKSVAEVNAM
ncbi:MAG TPA: dicarboxylate/amino acid:cation symporter [Caulobacteraceae bacterium]|jgi:Na+/H+-dicarboxylate symporter|nr:dicarboxylate/amino acid:cation symporter [Caulobacteraceae bacterium]